MPARAATPLDLRRVSALLTDRVRDSSGILASRATARAILRKPPSYGSLMSGKRASPGATGPMSGFFHIRLMWSAINISVPGRNVGRIPPAALVRISVATPSAWNTRAGSAATSGGCPS